MLSKYTSQHICYKFVTYLYIFCNIVRMKETDEEQAFAFWRRVDKLRKGKGTLQDLANVMEMKEQSLRVMRSRGSMPRALAVKALAEYLGTSQSYLLTGDEETAPEQGKDIPEVEFVRRNPEAQVLIRAVMNNPPLLSALSLVIAGTGSKIDTHNAEKIG